MKFVFLTVVGNLFLANAFTSIVSRQALERKTLLHASEQAPCVDDPKLIRNFALIGHSHAGKSSLAEWMLFDESIQKQMPTPGASSLDSDPVEASRHSSLFSHFMRIPHKKHLLEVADTPFGDFPTDASASLDGSDSAVIVISASDGVQSNAMNAFQYCTKAGIKSIIALNKMDRPFLDISGVLNDIKESFQIKPVPLQVYEGEGDDFKNVDSLILIGDDGKISRNLDAKFDHAWEILAETVAMTDDELLVEFLDNGFVEDDKILQGLRKAVLQQKLLPVVYTSALNNVGISELMDTIVAVFPNPMETREHVLTNVVEATGEEIRSVPGEEGGFTARVVHTSVDSFGSLSVIRVISNKFDPSTGRYAALPNEIVNLRSGTKVKLSSTCFGLCGKERLALSDNSQVLPGDVIALQKVDNAIATNDVICSKEALANEQHELELENLCDTLSPLSRQAPEISLMASATVSLTETGRGKKSSKKVSTGDDKLINALTALGREDLALKVEQHSGQWIVRCMSRDHLNLLVERLKDRYNIDVDIGDTPIPYRETISRTVTNVEGKHKKQSGGSGQFGVCYINVEPLAEGSGIEFESTVKGGAISKTFINSVEKGVVDQLNAGGPLGFPVTDVRVTVTDGKMHSVDSKDIAFQSAGRQAVKSALEIAGTKLLEPMEKVTFTIDESLQGDVNSIVSRSDGYIIDTVLKDNHEAEIDAIIPAACIEEVSETLRAESKGEGSYVTEFSHYQDVSDQKVKTICKKLDP